MKKFIKLSLWAFFIVSPVLVVEFCQSFIFSNPKIVVVGLIGFSMFMIFISYSLRLIDHKKQASK